MRTKCDCGGNLTKKTIGATTFYSCDNNCGLTYRVSEVEGVKWYEDPVYQKMCKKAEKIQQNWKPQDGDFYISDSRVVSISHCCPCADEDDMGTTEAVKGRDIWLPTQAQLQDMLKFEPWEGQLTPLHRLFFKFRKFVQNDDEDTWWDFKNEFTSMEQLWLAFVMKELYNKVWNTDCGEWVDA